MSDKYKYQIYIIALDDSILDRRDFRDRNPNHQHGKPCLYVGQTTKDPKVRFKQHMAGGKFSSRKVHKYGKYLRWRLFKKIPTVDTREEAEQLEQEVAENLQSKGYAVWWN
ncbi:GIY-YIG nuclease family protein [Balneola sp. MJW-20]|uniref:GIY-YIG nuclease family protein n=1 Tax=Gracilimonas aurantiaca TaxID=3234185 RepID=UPI003467913D